MCLISDVQLLESFLKTDRPAKTDLKLGVDSLVEADATLTVAKAVCGGAWVDKTKRAVLLMLFTAFLWSLAGVFIKLIEWDAVAIVCGRSLVASVTMFLFIRRQKFEWSRAMVGGALSYAAFTYCIVFSTKLTTSANAVMLQYTAPIYVAFFSWLILRETVCTADWICLAVVLCGMGLFFLDKMGGGSMLGNLIAIGNGISFAMVSIFLRLQKHGYPEQSIFLGGVFAVFLGIPITVTKAWTRPPSVQSIVIIAIAGVVIAVGYRLFTEASKELTALQTVMMPIIDPVLNPIWVFCVVGERPGVVSLCGGGIVLAAITVRSLLLIHTAPRVAGNCDESLPPNQ